MNILINFLLVGFVIFISGCGSETATTNPNTVTPTTNTTIPLGAATVGVTLTGPLAGKRAYALDSSINIPNCWNDSAIWTGSELYYGLGSASFTKLQAGLGLITDPACTLPTTPATNDNFDIYKAKIVNGAWQVSFQNIDPVNTEAGASVSGDSMAYTIYNPTGDWDIFIKQKISDNVWGAATAFSKNSICPEDNANIYANGTKMVFESSRLDALGATCDPVAENKSLWFSQKIGGIWNTPTLIPGTPNVGLKNTQPWVDEANNYLYWTDDKGCACIRRIQWVNDAPIGVAEDVITPEIVSLTDGTADGKIVFVGEYSHSDSHAFFACAKATKLGNGTDPNLYLGTWHINIDLCVVPRQ